MDLALNNLQRLICHKTQQTKPTIYHEVILKSYKEEELFTNLHGLFKAKGVLVEEQ